ncbi:unnamed protein product [Oreochromis niloticus]|nr:unnamed protein product [Mustela putorius furo]
MGLQGKVTPLQARRHEITLKNTKYDCKYPGSGEGVSGKPTAATWPWFALMDEMIGQMPSIKPPVLISSLPEDSPGPSAAVGDQNDSDDEAAQPPTTGRKRKGDGDDELLDLITEDMRQQREAEERRAGRGRTDCFHF